MTKKGKILAFINKFFAFTKLELAKRKAEESGISKRYEGPSYNKTYLDENTKQILDKDNEFLIELKQKYKKLDYPAMMHSFWSEKTLKTDEFDLRYFRGDNLYLWQYRSVGSSAHLKYLLYTYYIQNNDSLGLLNKLKEDDLFGVYLFDFNKKYLVSRDLLDSINEIYFLEKHLSISGSSDWVFLDIGAGYGRLAHRMINTFGDNISKYFCVDAIPESTFLCDFYLKFRNVDKKARSVPIYDIENILSENTVDIALNIHSFTECTFSAIEWWLKLVRKHNIKYLLIIPNPNPENKLLSVESSGERIDFMPLIESIGYKLKVYQPKINDPSVQEVLHHLPVFYYLFELNL